MSYLDEYNEQPKHRKRSKKKSPKKSDHKHAYEDIIAIKHYKNIKMIGPAKRCTICGKIEQTYMFFREKEQNGYNRALTDLDEIKQKYPHLPVVEIED